MAATPELPFPPVPTGHLTILPFPTDAFQAGLTSDRYVVNPWVVPEESDRWATVIAVLGRFMPGLSALIAGSFHDLTLPTKMFAIVGPSSFSPVLIPGR